MTARLKANALFDKEFRQSDPEARLARMADALWVQERATSDDSLVATGTGRRTRRPEQTSAALAELLDEIGVTRVSRVTGLDRAGIEVAIVVRPNAPGLSVRMGKGISWEQAKASAIMETIEFAFAETVVLPQYVCSAERAGDLAEICMAGRLPQYARNPFDARVEIAWTPAIDLLGGTVKWVPYDMVPVRVASHELPQGAMFEMSSNGLASGNCVEEAVLHALYELIERDATSLFFQMAFERRSLRRTSLGRGR